MSITTTPTTAARIGRFELRRKLGAGAQATVWLAHDPRLEREVSVKLFHEASEASDSYDWKREARNVSRLIHPNIVTLFEADLHDGKPYLVFEVVAGETLAERLRRRGAMAPRAAVHMLLGVLDALGAAHAAGVVHRDLKPSNIMVDADDRPRVMDFGIAAQVHESDSDGLIVGTLAYMSPEAARGEPPSPAMDVYAAGVMLIEMLTGTPPRRERDAQRALQRIVGEDLQLPATLKPEVDDVLRSAMLRAVARDPAQRWPSAAALHAALSAWLHPTPPSVSGSKDEGASSGTLEFLLRRMRHRADFPAMSDSIARIQRIARADNESLNSLVAEVSKDVALTNKLLRLVNTAQYSHAGGGTIATVARAVAMVGFVGIRNIAMSLVLLERMQDKAHAQQLKQEYLRSLMAGMMAHELAQTPREAEESFVGAMFHNLGRMLTEYYLVDEARQVRELVEAPAGGPKLSEAQAAVQVLGLSFDELGRGVGKRWGLPDTLLRCMRRPDGDPPARVAPAERLRWLTLAANEVADAVLGHEPAAAQQQVQAIGERYAKAIGCGPREFASALEHARERMLQTTLALDIVVPQGTPARRLIEAQDDATAVEPRAGGDATVVEAPRGGDANAAAADWPSTVALKPSPAADPARSASLLAAGIQDITNSMAADNAKLNDLLRMILETIYRALDFRCVVFCLRDPKTETLTGRFGLGEPAEQVRNAFRVPLRVGAGQEADLFSSLCLRGADSVIADASTPGIAARLPRWFRESVAAPAFLLLPLMVRKAPFALIYADKATAGSLQFTPQELALLNTLRNQAVMAFRQAG